MTKTGKTVAMNKSRRGERKGKRQQPAMVSPYLQEEYSASCRCCLFAPGRSLARKMRRLSLTSGSRRAVAAPATPTTVAVVLDRVPPAGSTLSFALPSKSSSATTQILTLTFTDPPLAALPAMVPSIRRNLPDSCLDGWSCHMDVPYGHVTRAEDLRPPAGARRVFLLARNPDGVLALGAMGEVDQVLAPTKLNQPRLHNGVHWHFTPSSSVGFSPTEIISQAPADTHDRYDKERLSWHLGGRMGGYRAGSRYALNDNEEWRKLVYWQ